MWKINLRKRLQKVNYRFLFVILVALSLIYLSEPGFPHTANGIFYLPYFIIGLCLIIVGECLRIWATGHLQKNRSLTTSGPYGYIKNPMYAGSFIILIGFNSLAINPWIHYILLVELVAFILIYIPSKRKIEAERLLEKFGSEYADYDRTVPDYIPRRLIPYQSTGRNIPNKWSSAVFRENQEVQVAFALLVGVIAIIVKIWLPY